MRIDSKSNARTEEVNEQFTYMPEGELNSVRQSIIDVLAAECDRRSVQAFIEGSNQLDAVLWDRAADLGWLGIGLPEDIGGLGLGQRGLDVLYRELGRRLAPGPFIATLTAAQWILTAADDDEQKKWLPRIVTGELTVALPAVTQPCMPLHLKDGRMSGHSGLLLGPESAGLAIVPGIGAHGNLFWALLEPGPPSVQLKAQRTWDRTRQVCTLVCNDAQPSKIINDNEGVVTSILTKQLGLAASGDSFGGAQAITRKTIDYMKSRVQFDRPIAAFQALKHRVADLAIAIEISENLLEQGVESVQLETSDSDMWVALTKASVTRASSFISADCVLLHGGIGFTWENECHIFLKRARLNEALGMNNRDQYDLAAQSLMNALSAGRSTTELSL